MMLERQVAARNGRLTCQGRFEISLDGRTREDKSLSSQPWRHGGRWKGLGFQKLTVWS